MRDRNARSIRSTSPVSRVARMACTRCKERVPLASLKWVSDEQGVLHAYCVDCQGRFRRRGE